MTDAFAQNTPSTTTATTVAAGTSEQVPYELTQEKQFKDTLMFLFLMFAIFYFLLIRPQQKRVKAHRELLGALKKGDRVITSGGIIGTVTKFEGDDIVVVEIAPNVRVRVARSMVSEKMSGDAPAISDNANDN